MLSKIKIITINRHRMSTDGKGVTSLIALPGCPLHCKYCINNDILEKPRFREYTTEQLVEEIMIDYCYFLSTGGGITFGGGESLLWAENILELRKVLRPEISINVETSLNIPFRKYSSDKASMSAVNSTNFERKIDDASVELISGRALDNAEEELNIKQTSNNTEVDSDVKQTSNNTEVDSDIKQTSNNTAVASDSDLISNRTTFDSESERSLLDELLENISEFIIDIKTGDDAIYKEYTGITNEHFKENIMHVVDRGFQDKCHLRIPIIPNHTTREDAIRDAKHFSELGFKNIEIFNYVIR